MEHLNNKIRVLKNNIQDILDICKKKKTPNEKIIELQAKKEEYIIELNDSIKELNIIKKNNEYKKVCRDNDSRTYQSVKNKPNVTILMENIKDNREKAKEIFQETEILKKTYMLNEQELIEKSKIKLPMFLFFSKLVKDKYKLCPFIELNDTCLFDRELWLSNQNDKGKVYYDLYDKVINKLDYNKYIDINNSLEEYFTQLHKEILNESQYKTLGTIISNIEEYISHTVKTKKLKDKFNIIINNFSNLTKEIGYKLNEYFSTYYNIVIPINDYKLLGEGNLNLIKIYEDKLYDYKLNKDEITNSLKYITNTTNNLTLEFYEYLYIYNIKKCELKQEGKYFKNWSLLLDEEKLDRFHSFSEYLIKKNENATETENATEKIDSLKKIFNDNYKNIKFKNIKWNVQLGIIQQISCLKFNEINQCYVICIENKTETTKKISSIKSIFNKHNEPIINEELLMFLITAKKNDKLNDENIKELQVSFLEKIKIKLQLKRIGVNDKIQLNLTFDSIYNIVYNNQCI